MKMFGFKIIGVVLVLALWPAAARAQVTAPREGAQIQFGPVGLYPSLQIVDAGRDSNVFDDGANPKKDDTFTVQSRALVVTRLGLNELMVSTGSDYVWFRRYKGERSSNGTYALRFNLSASRFKPFIGADRSRTRARPNAEIDVRARRLERSALAGTNFNLTERTAITSSIRADDSSYDNGQRFRGVDLAQALNRTGRSYTGGVRYLLTPLTTLVMAGNYALDIFPKSHIRDSKTYSFAPALEFSPDAAIRGRMAGGIEIFKPNDRELAEYKGAVFSAGLNWSLFNRTTFDLGTNRNVSYSYRDTEPYYLSTGARLTVSQKTFGALDLVGTLDRQHMLYRWRRGVAATSNPPADTTDAVGAGVGINMQHGFRVVLTAERTTRRAREDSSQNYKRLRLLSTITIGQ
jgi:hypothetical protein